jgi:hypothetical protein
MLEDPTLRDYIAWSEDGKSFLVYNPSDFARDVLPRFFKHSNFSSFLRQVRLKACQCWARRMKLTGVVSTGSATFTTGPSASSFPPLPAPTPERYTGRI